MDPIAVVVTSHALAGAAALLGFWSAAGLRKGSPRHRLAGRVYLWAMAGVVVSGVPLAAERLLDGRWVGGTFLAYLLVLVATPVWLGWRAVRDRGDAARYLGPAYVALAALNLLAGVAVLAVGLMRGVPLLAGFSLVGVLTAADMWRRRRRIPAEPRWWLREHYAAMTAGGAAIHTAFFVTGLPRLAPALVDSPVYYVAWFAPTLLSIAVLRWLDRRYAQGLARPAPAVVAAGVGIT